MKRAQNPPKLPPLPLSAGSLRAIERRGISHYGWRDLYYNLMTMPLPALMAVLALYFLTVILAFAIALYSAGGLRGVGAGSFAGAFFFAVQTVSTTGYGSIYPVSFAANSIATAGMLIGQLNMALATSLIFARLSRPRPRVMFSKVMVVRERPDGAMLMFRVANERRSEISAAQMSVVMTYDEDDGDGGTLRRLVKLPLEREFSPIFALSWLVMHRITPESPLWGKTRADLARQGNVLVCSLTGTDDALNASITARHVYGAEDVRFGHRFVDVINRTPSGEVSIDYAQFHDTVQHSN